VEEETHHERAKERREHEAPEGWGWVTGDLPGHEPRSIPLDGCDARAGRDLDCGRWTGGAVMWVEPKPWRWGTWIRCDPDSEVGPLLGTFQLGHFTTSGGTVTYLRGLVKG
jgi:hypothetical protein